MPSLLLSPDWQPASATRMSPKAKPQLAPICTDLTTPKRKPHLSLIRTNSMNPAAPEWRPTRTPSPPNLEGTQLFDFVRRHFCAGLSTLDNLLRYLELRGASECKGRRRGIESLLNNLLTLAQWLVSYLDNVRLWQCENVKVKAAIIGTRVELHQYSWKVTRVATILASA